MFTEKTICFWQNFPQTIFYNRTAIMAVRLKYKINTKKKETGLHDILLHAPLFFCLNCLNFLK